MRFSELHRAQERVISFELFPPKTPDAETRLFEQTLPELLKLRPAFLTCTYGAGGSTRDKTLDVVTRIRRDFGVEAASHLTCVGASKEEIAAYLDRAQAGGISNIVALRGDPPAGDTTFRPHPDGFKHADQLIRFVKARGGFDVAAAGYPEGHPEAPDKYQDWDRCADKVEAGADVIITQLFYDNNDYFAFADYLRNKRGVKVPIVPGVLPILNAAQIKRFCGLCGAKLPPAVVRRLEELADDNEACRKYGVELATQMSAELLGQGAPGIHFYTLNRSDSTREIMLNLGLVASA